MISASDIVLQKDMFQRSLAFLESLLLFVEHCYGLQRRTRDTDRVFVIYEELLRMC